MADSFVQLPYTATTSGQILDSEQLTVGANVVQRERMQITGTAASQIAPVTTSGGLLVTLSTVPGYLVTLSSNPVAGQVVSLSSATVTFSSAPTVNVSSGIVTLSSNPTVNVSSGIITITSGTVTGIYLTGTSGGTAVVTTSGGLQVEVTNGSPGGGSTDVSVVGSTGTQWAISSAGVAEVGIFSSGGIQAPVTSSFGLAITNPVAIVETMQSSIGAPTAQSFTTLPCTWYSLTVVATQAASHAVKFYTATTLTSNASTYFQVQIPAVANVYNFPFAGGGVTATGGLHFTVTLNTTSTSATTTAYMMIVNYKL